MQISVILGSLLEVTWGHFCTLFGGVFQVWFQMGFWSCGGGSAAQAGVAGKGKGSSQKPVLEGSGMI